MFLTLNYIRTDISIRHQVEMPDGMKLWGILLESIDGPTMEHVDAATWSRETQINFVSVFGPSVFAANR